MQTPHRFVMCVSKLGLLGIFMILSSIVNFTRLKRQIIGSKTVDGTSLPLICDSSCLKFVAEYDLRWFQI